MRGACIDGKCRDLQDILAGAINYCAEPEASMMSSVDGGSRMEGESVIQNDNSFLAEAAPSPPQNMQGPLRQRAGVMGNRINSNPMGGCGSQLSSIMEGSQGDVTMSVTAWAQTAAAAPEDSKLDDSTFGQPDEASECSAALAAGESLLSESAVIVPSRTAVRSRTRTGPLLVKSSPTGAGRSEPVHRTLGSRVGVADRDPDADSPRYVPMGTGIGGDSSMLEQPATALIHREPGASQSAAMATAQRSGALQQTQRPSRIPRHSSVSSAASTDEGTPRAAAGGDAPPPAPSTNSRRLTDLFLPTSPPFAGDGSPGSSALGSAMSGVDADISAALEDESSMNLVGTGSRISNAAFRHPPGARQVGKGRLPTLGMARDTPKSTPREKRGSITSVSATVSTPGRNEDGTEVKNSDARPQQRSSGAQWQDQSSGALSSSFLEPEGVEQETVSRDQVGVAAWQHYPGVGRAGQSSSAPKQPAVRTGGSSGSNSGTSDPSYALRKLGSGSAATAATDPASALHDSLQPPPTPDKSPVPGASSPATSKAPQAAAGSGNSLYAQTAGLVSTELKSIRRKSFTVTSLGDAQLRQGNEEVKKSKSRTLSAREIAGMAESRSTKPAAPSLPIQKDINAAFDIEHVHAIEAAFCGGMLTICLPISSMYPG